MEKISKTILYFCFVILITACSKDDKDNEDKLAEDIYITGTENNKAVYWKNGEKTILSNTNSSASSIFVTDNDDVYVAGSEGDKAVYWKNGAKTILEENDAVVNDIWVSQNDIVHAVGDKKDLTSQATDKYEAIYWKNDQENLLYQGEKAVNILVKDETVYIVGYFKNGEVGYWKDGVQVILPEDNVIIVDCHSIYINNNNLYIAANIITQESAPNTIGAYWLNNNLEELPETENNSSSVTDITVVDEKLYATGFEKDINNKKRPVYWAGITKEYLPFNDINYSSSAATGIFTVDTNKFIVGYVTETVSNTDFFGYACYWKNGVETILPDKMQYPFGVSDIFVKTSN
ncbi:hypothetical protein [Aquimarina algiphila]|uniref:hypothetical protein n=1 Tax=Aquimarina algiphila TaxID=2047982 RepID=UPI00232AB4B2|nr:hypothetical protein [Aquimarina algiphila]